MPDIPLLADSPGALEALARVEILYTDLDGTLLGRGGSLLAAGASAEPSAVAADAIVSVNRAGLPVVIVSGRSRIQLMEIARLCGWSDFIAEAGAVRSRWDGESRSVVYDTGSWPAGLPAEGRGVFDEIAASGAYEALAEAFPGRVEYHDPWHLHRDASHVLRGCLPAAEAQAVLDALPLPLDLIDNGLVRRRFGGLSCGEAPVHAYHVVPRGVSKRRAIELDLAERGLASEQAMMAGDSLADLGTAPAVGLCALVANALEAPGVSEALGMHENVYLLRGQRGEGWAELAEAWLAARGG